MHKYFVEYRLIIYKIVKLNLYYQEVIALKKEPQSFGYVFNSYTSRSMN